MKLFGISFQLWIIMQSWYVLKHSEVEWFHKDLQDLLEWTPKKDVLFIIRWWKVGKVGSQEIPGVTGKFGLGVQNEAGQRLIVLPTQGTAQETGGLACSVHGVTKGRTLLSNWTETECLLFLFQECSLNFYKTVRALIETQGWIKRCQSPSH